MQEGRSLIIAAHPDDETIGLGARLPAMKELAAVIFATDGAPRNGIDARLAGCSSWQEYALLRRHEAQAVLDAAGQIAALVCLNIADQQVVHKLQDVIDAVILLLQEHRPEVIYTHPYEGGHPDHDAVSFAVNMAVSSISPEQKAPRVYEFASYHAAPDGIETERFLPHQESQVEDLVLTDEQADAKRGLLHLYASQQRVLSMFPVQREPIRLAPAYDYTKAPHTGKLLYERQQWGVTDGRHWRELAATVLKRRPE